jgi:hypothetical protein
MEDAIRSIKVAATGAPSNWTNPAIELMFSPFLYQENGEFDLAISTIQAANTAKDGSKATQSGAPASFGRLATHRYRSEDLVF